MLPPKLIVLRPPEPGKGLGSSDDERSSLSFMLGHMLGACEGSAHCVLSCQELCIRHGHFGMPCAADA